MTFSVTINNHSGFKRSLQSCFDGFSNAIRKVGACVGAVLEKGVEVIAALDRMTLRLGPSISITVESIHQGDHRETVFGVVQIARSLSALGGTVSAAATVPLLQGSANIVPSTAAFFWVFWFCNLILEGAAADSCRKIYRQEENDHTLIERPLKRTFNDQFQRDLQQLLFAGETPQIQRALKKFLKRQETSSYFLMGLYLAFTGVIFSQGMDPKIIFGATGANSLVKFLRYLGLSRQLKKIEAIHQNQQMESASHISGEIDLTHMRSLTFPSDVVVSPTPLHFGASDSSSPNDEEMNPFTPPPSPISGASLPSSPVPMMLAHFPSDQSLSIPYGGERDSPEEFSEVLPLTLRQIAELYQFDQILCPNPTHSANEQV